MQGLKVVLTWMAALAAVGCVGQSGSEAAPSTNPGMTPGGAPPIPSGQPPRTPPQPHCPCDGYSQFLVVRAAVVGTQAFPEVGTVRYELVAREILGPDPLERDEIQVADHFGGYWSGQLGCGGAAEPAKLGDEVLAFYRPGRQDSQECCEYIACSSRCTDAKADNCRESCEATTRDACAAHHEEAVMRGELMLIPWGDRFVVGTSETRTASIEQNQIASLSKPRDACKSEVSDLFGMLYPPQSSTPSQPESDSAAGSGDSLPPASMPAAPTPPQPSASRPTPPPLAPVNPTAPATPPPAGPEEVRVRCAK